MDWSTRLSELALEAAGYDRDFAELRQDDRPPGPPHPGSWRAVAIVGGVLFRPAGTKLDLNGVVKSMAVDDAVALLPGDGYVSAGGDLATRGGMDVLLPSGGTVLLRGGGIATSGSSRRRWIRGGELQHHLIDPRTGRPARSCWTDVTVAAGRASLPTSLRGPRSSSPRTVRDGSTTAGLRARSSLRRESGPRIGRGTS